MKCTDDYKAYSDNANLICLFSDSYMCCGDSDGASWETIKIVLIVIAVLIVICCVCACIYYYVMYGPVPGSSSVAPSDDDEPEKVKPKPAPVTVTNPVTHGHDAGFAKPQPPHMASSPRCADPRSQPSPRPSPRDAFVQNLKEQEEQQQHASLREEEARQRAATRIQAVHRGQMDRAQVKEKRGPSQAAGARQVKATASKCPKCGDALAASERFCGECGYRRP